MKHLYAPTRTTIQRTRIGLLTCGLLSLAISGKAQLSLATPGVPAVIDFDGTVSGVSNGAFVGNGFSPNPISGALDSDAWRMERWSDGDMDFGDIRVTTSTDYRRGAAPSNNPISVAGIWSFGGVGITGRALGFQPGTGDFTPGNAILRVQNNTGSTLTEFDVAYNLYYRNDQGRSTSWRFFYSEDLVNFVHVPSIDVITPTTATGTAWVANAQSTTITGVLVAPGEYFYIRWSSNDVAGSGGRDELALDDISVTGRVSTSVVLTSTSAALSETAGSVGITVEIANPSPLDPTTVDLVLISGAADRIDGYTTQTVTFPPGDGTNKTVNVPITDNGACDGSATLVFQLQNVSGGLPPAAIGPVQQFTLSLTDDNMAPTSDGQGFDGLPQDTWNMTSGGVFLNTNTGATDRPANQRVLTGTTSWQVHYANTAFELAPINVADRMGTVLTARVSSTAPGDVNNGADITDSIAFFVSLDGAPFSPMPDVRIRGAVSTNSRWGYDATGVAATTAGTPALFQPAGSGLRTTDGYSTVRISIPDGTTTVALRVTAVNNSHSECWNVDDIRLEGMQCSPIYYSRADGSESTGTWSTTPSGTPAPHTVVFSQHAVAIVQTPHQVTTTSAATINLRNLTVETGAGLTLTGATDLRIHGTHLTVDGSLTGADATLRFLGPEAKTFSSVDPITLFNLQVNGPTVTQQLNALRIRGSLDVTAGAYNANNIGNPARNLTLVSEASGTGRLGPVIPPAAFTGNIVMERYVPGGATNWRLISAATLNNTLSSLEDDFVTAGYPGSHYPNFESPVGSGILWPSIRTYDESNPGAGMNDGLIGATGDNMVMAPGLGFMAWAGTGMSTTTPFVIDLRSVPHQGHPGITLPMSWTNTGQTTVDGWNLVGNPLPSPIDFSTISKGADVANYYYVFDPASGNNAIWDETLGLSIPSGALNGNIQSCQGFWLKANGPSVSTVVTESNKVLDRSGGGLFGGAMGGQSPLFRLEISSNMNSYKDETLVHLGVGAPGLGEHDIVKFPLSHPSAPRIQSISQDGHDLMLNAFGALEGAAEIPVSIAVQVDGTYSIRIQDAIGVAGMSCLVLEDLHTGISTILTEGSQYTFTAQAATPAQPARFRVHLSAPVEHLVSNVSCAGAADGQATVIGAGEGPWNVTWMTAAGSVIRVDEGVTGSASMSDLAPGNYAVSIDGNAACGTLTHDFSIAQPLPLTLDVATTAASCTSAEDGTATVNVMGGAAPYTMLWANGTTSETFQGAPGAHEVTVTDGHGCSTTTTVHIPAVAGPEAAFTLSSASLYTGDTLFLNSTSGFASEQVWDLGDGTTMQGSEASHVYTAPGTYTVALTITEGDCSDVANSTITVSVAQSVGTVTRNDTRVWTNGNDLLIDWSSSASGNATVDVLDATGRSVHAAQVKTTGRSIIPAQGLPSGVYFVRITNNGSQQTMRVPLIR